MNPESDEYESPRKDGILSIIWIIVPIVALCTGASLNGQGTTPDSPGVVKSPSSQAGRGEALAHVACGSCHLFPEPGILDKKTWKQEVLPRMETRLGISPPDYSKSAEGELIRSLHIYPDGPAMPQADWDAIVEYYLSNAPDVAIPQGPRPEIQVGLKQFEVMPAKARRTPALTTMTKISPAAHRIFVGDDQAKGLAILDATGQIVDSLQVGNVPINLVETPRGIYVTAIGNFQPSEAQKGALLFFEKKDDHFGEQKVILKDLPRATQTEFCDFNGDGKMDFAICMFGNLRGRFSWFENLGNDEYKEHILFEKAGAIHCVAYDFNKDGFPDIGLLVAQETESFFIFTNDGKGNFTRETVFQKHPAFGHNYFELADFNGDGLMDLLVVNGDNGEYESPLKAYHGVRIYLNKGKNRFEEAYFFPLNGAIKAVARDFDGDGDLDIAVISFFPDYTNSPRESFVYLENKGGLNFSPSTFRECIAGRWIVMDVDDLDGDGDLDIVLGSYIHGPTKVPDFLMQIWEKQGPSVMILKNKLRQ